MGLPVWRRTGGERSTWMGYGWGVAQRVYAMIDGAYPVGREYAHDHHEDRHRPQSDMLAHGEIVCGCAVHQWRFRSVEDALHHPQHVGRAENDADSAERAPEMMGREAARQREELADEAIQDRQADEREHRKQEKRGEPGRFRCESAVTLDLVSAVPLVHDAEEYQQRAAGDRFAGDVEDRD